HETFKKIENCTNCEDNIKRQYSYYSYFSIIYQSINKIKNYLVELEKGEKKEQEKKDIIYKLGDELINIDVEIKDHALCKICQVEHKLSNLLNKLTNRSDLTVRISGLSNELLETLKKIENCT